MRISYWSSDVCSSDLDRALVPAGLCLRTGFGRGSRRPRASQCRLARLARRKLLVARCADVAAAETDSASAHRDFAGRGGSGGGGAAGHREILAARERGVCGKVVVGRVDRGGLRLIKKKKNRREADRIRVSQ